MSKGNPFLGQLRGSVGDVVFSRMGGQQIARSRNRQPKNPRSRKQMRQRSVFADCVKFFTRGNQNLFKFAFEDKKVNESDYNAFMRHNVRNAVHIGYNASKSPVYPALGEWQMTAGTLNIGNLTFNGNHWTLPVQGVSSNMTTFGEVCGALKSSYNLTEGDIITLVHIVAIGCTEATYRPDGPFDDLSGTNWYLSQFIVDESNDTRLVDMGWIADDNVLIFQPGTAEMAGYAQGFSVVFSRNSRYGLKVSTSYLIGNEVATALITRARSEEWIEEVIASWSASGDAILQGSLAESVPTDMVFKVNPRAFTLGEAGSIQGYYQQQKVQPTDIEFYMDGSPLPPTSPYIGTEVSFASGKAMMWSYPDQFVAFYFECNDAGDLLSTGVFKATADNGGSFEIKLK